MAKDMNNPLESGGKKSKLIVRLMLPMLLLGLLEILTFFTILIVGGEFSYIRRYAYNTLVEKTENRRNYIEKDFQEKVPFVYESVDKIEDIIDDILTKQRASITDIQKDKELNNLILESSVESLVELLRHSKANDVYLILDTGSLYEDNGSTTMAALYLRDLDTTTDAGYEDLLMEMGLSSISQEYGIMLDSGWTLRFAPDPDDMESFGFYYTTMDVAKENSTLLQRELGYWSGFSKPSRNAAASLKYTVPLIDDDGTVYGVLGIGLTDNAILSDLPSNDFIDEEACYVLGHSTADSIFDIITHSGASFTRLVGSEKYLHVSQILDENVYAFASHSELELAGSVRYIDLYQPDSPYYGERWTIISVADKESVLRPLVNLINMLTIAAIVSFVIGVIVIIISCREVVKPIAAAIKIMDSSKEYSHVIHFQPSNIYELDKMTDAITQLQINVQNFSSQVSQMIRIADVGLGTFLYTRADDSVFVGQSLLKFLRLETEQDEDMVMSRSEFLESIIAEETRQAITEGLKLMPDESTDDQTETDHVKEYSVANEDGTMVWMRLNLVYNKNKSVGILQDITGEMMEKKRIEYERDYDSITGLLNRNAYYHRIEKLFHEPDQLKTTAFIMIDLDNLKYVNDTYGHDFGDDYIKTAATALKKFQNYGGIVARLSGDEFNVCLPGFSSKEEIMEIVNKVREKMLQSYCLLADGKHFKIRASAGISWYPDDATSYEMLMKYADFAMYTVKHSTKGELAQFDMNAYAMDAVLLNGVEEMNRIIDECSVQYAFQSIISAKTGEIYGYEALLRPQSTIFQSPLELLRIAKSSAKLYEIERLTWTKALNDFQVQIDAGRIEKDSYIFINSISDNVLEVSDVEAIEAAHPDMLSRIVLEILESEGVNEAYNARKIARMKKWNAQIALDDFGTGYNSEYALITIQPHIVKIDRSIISGCDTDMSRRTIINNIVKLAKTKNILVLAEGVETEEEVRTVISCGVDLMQGFYFTRPLFEPQPLSDEVKDMIKEWADNK